MNYLELLTEIRLTKGRLMTCSCPIEQARLLTALVALYDSYVFLTMQGEREKREAA